MNISKPLRDLKRMLDQNSPVVLTALAVTGACATAYLAATGGYKAAQAVDYLEITRGEAETTKQDKFIVTYKFYAPAAVTLVGTSVCMVMATKIGLNRTAALTGALVLAERTNDQYKDKVKEVFGISKATKVDDAVATDQVTKGDIPATFLLQNDQQIFWDRRNGRPFATTRNDMDKQVNFFNQDVLLNDYANLNEFYKQIGLDEVEGGDEIGWNRADLVELSYTTVLKGDRAVQAFGFVRPPMPDFQKDYV